MWPGKWAWTIYESSPVFRVPSARRLICIGGCGEDEPCGPRDGCEGREARPLGQGRRGPVRSVAPWPRGGVVVVCEWRVIVPQTLTCSEQGAETPRRARGARREARPRRRGGRWRARFGVGRPTRGLPRYGDKSSEPRLNLSGSWQQGHSAAYNTPFLIQVVCK